MTDNRRFLTVAIAICILALIAGLALGAMAAQIQDAQMIQATNEAIFRGVGQ